MLRGGPTRSRSARGPSPPSVRCGPSPPSMRCGHSLPSVRSGPSPPSVRRGPSPPSMRCAQVFGALMLRGGPSSSAAQGPSGSRSSLLATSLVLLLAQVTGFYTISSVLLIRKNVPLRYRCVFCTGRALGAGVLRDGWGLGRRHCTAP